MKHRLTATLALVLAACAMLAATATAGGAKGRPYEFRGHVVAVSATSVQLRVEGGNHAALKALLGQSQNQTFTLGTRSEVLLWAKGIPRIGGVADLRLGDWVNLRVRAAVHASLADIEATPAAVVSDRTVEPTPPARPLFLYVGTVGGPQSGGHVALHVTAGNHLALHTLLGQSVDQTFTYDDGTIFLLWQGKVPTVIDASQLKAGDRITVRIRAPHRSTLAQVEATAAAHIGDHEPGNPLTQK
jgi:hypothetical protein